MRGQGGDCAPRCVCRFLASPRFAGGPGGQRALARWRGIQRACDRHRAASPPASPVAASPLPTFTLRPSTSDPSNLPTTLLAPSGRLQRPKARLRTAFPPSTDARPRLAFKVASPGHSGTLP
ncbi:hypothetical protein WHR41_00075 [Cladosporium halotolerans]|uniref:Uncharacterized protein n=1 Tax=Cladosporium halotolerans TaxID=1052096 RepID=A0AB34L1X5_9PEZI